MQKEKDCCNMWNLNFYYLVFRYLLHDWKNYFVAIGWKQANFSLIVNLPCSTNYRAHILRFLSHIMSNCTKARAIKDLRFVQYLYRIFKYLQYCNSLISHSHSYQLEREGFFLKLSLILCDLYVFYNAQKTFPGSKSRRYFQVVSKWRSLAGEEFFEHVWTTSTFLAC